MQSRNQREGRYAGHCNSHIRDGKAQLAISKRLPKTEAARFIKLCRRRIWAKPKPMNVDPLNVLEAAKRVLNTHADVVTKLGDR